MTATRYTFCRICEATCGLAVTVDNNRVQKIEPDREHVVSQGFVCVKGTHFDQVQNSPDRITAPMKRTSSGWQTISWDQAMTEIGERIKTLRQQHGADSIGHFVGSPAGANVLSPLFRNAFFKALGSRRFYGTPTTDTTNKFRVNEDMYGSPFRLAFPDVNHCHFLMVIGANPAVSGNTLYHLPRAKARMREIVKRGGRVVFINPRRIETAAAGEHYFIRPDTDVYFLAAFLNELIAAGQADLDRIDAYYKGFQSLRETVAGWDAERQAAVTGIPADTLRELVAAHGAASGAALYMATGVNQGRHGTLCFWLLEAINAVSGNLDARGGTLMGEGLFDMAREVNEAGDLLLAHERGDGFPTVVGNHPSGLLADDILGGDVRALIVEASNPFLACSNPGGRLERAFEKLDLLVCIDLFRNEVGNLAHYILPAPTWLERAEIPYALQSFAGNNPTPYMIYSDAVVEAPPEVRHEWWMFSRLARACDLRLFDSRAVTWLLGLNDRLVYHPWRWLRRLALTPERMLNGMLKKAGLPGRRTFMRDHPHGLLLGENRTGTFLGTERVLTDDGRVDLAPQAYVQAFAELVPAHYEEELAQRHSFKLIGKREIRRINTSSANVPRLVKEETNYCYLHPADARDLGLAEGGKVEVRSRHGCIRIPVRITDDMMPRTVAIPQCWGHARADGLSHAIRHAGVNSNLLAGDGMDNVERLSGMSHLSGIPVQISAVAD
ncbi:molybdopterin-containing oxidoreductase family protein [Parahaliea aestuarii]|nr:molybdopterin-dependent oxidoreductase [Parahaliea aestuarii]